MSQDLWMGIDLGTQGVRALVVDETGRRVASGQTTFATRPLALGAMIHNPIEDWSDGTISAIREAVDHTDPQRIAGVGVCGLFPAIVLVDRHGEPIGDAILHGDTRARAFVPEAEARLGVPLAGDEVAPRLLWLVATRPDQVDRVARILGPAGFIIHLLTGRTVTDPQSAYRWGGLVDASRRSWRDGASTMLGIPKGVFPDILSPTEVAGQVTTIAAAATGLMAGTPVMGGATDSLATFVGHGATGAGDALAYYGSSWTLMAATVDIHRVLADPSLIGTAAPWRLAAYGVDAGRFVEQLRQEVFGGLTFQDLDLRAAESPPGSNGVVVVPMALGQFDGRRITPAHGLVGGLSLEHGPADLWRATLESLGHMVAVGLARLDLPIRMVAAAGGGAQSPVWREIVSNITGLAQRYHPRGSAAFGAAFLAATGLGAVHQLDPVAAGWLPEEEAVITRPDQAIADLYRAETRAWDVYAEAAIEIDARTSY